MAARPTMFQGKMIEPVSRFSQSWATRLRPNFPPSRPIARLKDLHLGTALVRGGKPACVLLVPEGRYAAEVELVREAVRRKTGVTLPVTTLPADPAAPVDPEALLAGTHVITFGNMATNPFLHRLYRRWLTLLDRAWPGPGGHALLTLHNPFGNGWNAVLVGGSADGGVAGSARRLADRIAAAPGATLGRLHDIMLGGGLEPPEPWKGEPMYFWAGVPGKPGKIGARAACFGWNSIAAYACLYYMTGRREYAERFRELALSRPGHVPEALREDYCYWNPANPLVETYHYYSWIIPLLWDLIEESPVFSDADRVRITNKLIEQQDHYDPNDDFGAPNGSRHASYQMLNIYTGSLYLAKYYPERRWFQRVANIRAAFDAWKTGRTWGELDLVPWMPTSIEFVFNFFLMDDSGDAFTRCGAATEMIAPQLHLWTGTPLEDVNRQQPLSLMNKAAWLLHDGTWLWLAGQAPYRRDVFRIGQSWLPPPDLAPEPPVRIVDRVANIPLQKPYWERAGKTIPLDRGSQFLVYRDSLDANGDYLRIDVSWFCDRNPYHLVTPDLLRIGGTDLVTGLGSLVTVYRRGLLEPVRTPQMAVVEGRVGADGGAVMRFLVPNMSWSAWRRTVLHRTGVCTVFVDAVEPRSDGPLEIVVDWKTAGAMGAALDEDRRMGWARSSVTDAVFAGADAVETPGGALRLVRRGDCKRGEPTRILTILAPHGERRRTFHRLSRDVYAWRETALVFTGPGRARGLRIRAEAAYIDAERFLAAGIAACEIGPWRMRADRPMTFAWDLRTGALQLDAPADSALAVGGKRFAVKKGVNTFVLPAPESLADAVRAALAEQAGNDGIPAAAAGRPLTEAELQGHAAWERDSDDVPCLRFAHDGDWAMIPGDILPALPAFTIEAWVKSERFIPPAEAERTHIASQAVIAKWAIKNDQRAWMLMLTGDRVAFWTSPRGTYDGVRRLEHPEPARPGWNHLAVVAENGTATLVVNGRPASPVRVGSVYPAATPISIGCYLTGYPLRGRVCGVRIYDCAVPLERLAGHAQAGPKASASESHGPVFELRPSDVPRTHAAAAADSAIQRPRRVVRLPGSVRRLRIAPADCGNAVWVACDPGRLVLLTPDGNIRAEHEFPAPITALAVAPDAETYGRVAALVGLDDDQVVGLDENGGVLWTEKAEIHSRFWLGGHWRAPWFTDPENCHGVLDLRFIRWRKGEPAEIALGRGCTVELRGLDGGLIERFPVEWGDRAVLGESRDREGRPTLTAANWYRSLGANMQCITADRKPGGSVYYRLPGDYTRIPGHGQGFLYPHLEDLDGDGRGEFLTVLCGTWNDLIVYDARAQAPKWVRVFGAWKRGAVPLVCGVSVGDVNGDGKREVLAAARNGWVWLFGPDGALLWARHSDSPAEAVLLAGRHAFVGRRDGTVERFDPAGRCVTVGRLDGEVTRLVVESDATLLAATSAGTLAFFPLAFP